MLWIAAVIALAATVLLVSRHVAVAVTPSLRYTVFYLTRATGHEIHKGDYVLFQLDHPMTKELKFNKAVKEVVCEGGDMLAVRGGDFFCNGVLLGRAKDRSLKGEKADQFRYSGIVPAQSLFVMGHSIDSFDSRYFGFIGIKDVENRAQPLF
jgi:conjugative transfer signal peptidase TraF